MQSLIQKEGKAHNEDMAKADKKIPLPEKTYKAMEKKAKAEVKTPNEKTAEIVDEKAKDAFAAKINKYGFLHFSKELMETLGWAKGEDIKVKITKTANGIAVERT
jgi:hypothetical protein